VTTLNSPRTGIIGTTSNKLTYRLFTGAPLTGDYFCGATTPATPNKSAMDCREWTAVSGIIEVTTTTNTAFKHTIVQKNFKGGNSTFLLGDNYVYGDLLTTFYLFPKNKHKKVPFVITNGTFFLNNKTFIYCFV
jgi:hypothetical protein